MALVAQSDVALLADVNKSEDCFGWDSYLVWDHVHRPSTQLAYSDFWACDTSAVKIKRRIICVIDVVDEALVLNHESLETLLEGVEIRDKYVVVC